MSYFGRQNDDRSIITLDNIVPYKHAPWVNEMVSLHNEKGGYIYPKGGLLCMKVIKRHWKPPC